MKLLLTFFTLCCAVVSCSDVFSNIARYYYNNSNRTPRVYEGIAEAALNYKISSEGNKMTSIFDSLLKAVSPLQGISTITEYKRLIVGLDDHLKSYCLSILLKAKGNTLTAPESEFFLKKLLYTLHENDHCGAFYVEQLEFSPRTLEFVFSAIKEVDTRFKRIKVNPRAIDLKYSEALLLTTEFVKYCKTDAQLKEPLSLILKIIEKEYRVVPFVKFNLLLEEFEEYNNFVRQCSINHNKNGQNNYSIARTIIYGPFSPITAEILYFIGLNNVVEELCQFEIDRNRLICHIISPYRREMFYQYIEANPLSITENLKRDAENQLSNLSAIVAFMNFDPNGGSEKFAEIIELFKEKANALREFYRIDKKFVELCIIGIDNIISLIVGVLKVQVCNTNFDALLMLIMMYYSALPAIYLENFTSNTIEQVLELMVHPWADTRLLVSGFGQTIRGILDLPYVKIDASVWTKLYNLFSKAVDDSGATEVIDSYSISAIFSYSRNDSFEVFKEIHKFRESKGLCSDFLAEFSILRAIYDYSNTLAKQLVDYSNEHGLLSKSYALIAAKLLEKMQDPDYRSIHLKLTKNVQPHLTR